MFRKRSWKVATWRCALVLSGGVVMLSCAASSTRPTEPAVISKPIAFNSPFTLRVGESAYSPDIGRFQLREVRDDSRCPADVTCVWAGDAVVTVMLRPVSSRTRKTTWKLSTSKPLVWFDEYSGSFWLELLELAPAPHSGTAIAEGDYEATFKLGRSHAL